MQKPTETEIFLGDEKANCDYDESLVVVLPVPLERTTSYRKGTAHGPQAILAASGQVELYDEELRLEPFRIGLTTLAALEDRGDSLSDYLDQLARQVEGHFKLGKFVLTLGGEHTLSQAPIHAAQSHFGEIATVQFDAHADLRDRFEGSRLSHACVMRRTHELGVANLAIGIRSLSSTEATLIESARLPVVWGRELEELTVRRFRRLLADLPQRIYLTLDVDFFDPSLIPATGTPEPGGGTWQGTLPLLRVLFAEKEVVAMDLVELSPIAGNPSSDFAIARLAYKCVGYLQIGQK